MKIYFISKIHLLDTRCLLLHYKVHSQCLCAAGFNFLHHTCELWVLCGSDISVTLCNKLNHSNLVYHKVTKCFTGKGKKQQIKTNVGAVADISIKCTMLSLGGKSEALSKSVGDKKKKKENQQILEICLSCRKCY